MTKPKKRRRAKAAPKTDSRTSGLLIRLGEVVENALRDRMKISGAYGLTPFRVAPEDREEFGKVIAGALVGDGWELRCPANSAAPFYKLERVTP